MKIRTKKTLWTTLPLLALLSSPWLVADTLQMPDPSADTRVGAEPWNVPVPSKGMSKTQVEAQFGTPDSRNGPRGEPPIYFWEYPEYTVYFESDYVIHTVRKYKPE